MIDCDRPIFIFYCFAEKMIKFKTFSVQIFIKIFLLDCGDFCEILLCNELSAFLVRTISHSFQISADGLVSIVCRIRFSHLSVFVKWRISTDNELSHEIQQSVDTILEDNNGIYIIPIPTQDVWLRVRKERHFLQVQV